MWVGLQEDATLDELERAELLNIFERKDDHEPEIERLAVHDESFAEVTKQILNADPPDWGYPVADWQEVRRTIELQQLGLSRMQAIVWIWKTKGLTHLEIAQALGIGQATLDPHSRRVNEKRGQAKCLLATLEIE